MADTLTARAAADLAARQAADAATTEAERQERRLDVYEAARDARAALVAGYRGDAR